MKMFSLLKDFFISVLSIFKGLAVTMKNLFRPAVTLQYPQEKQPMTENFRGMVDLYPEKCVICYMCIKICPTAALDLAHQQIVKEEKKLKEITKFTFNGELCCYCGLCEEVCPTDAIFLNKLYEVISDNHQDISNFDLMDPLKYQKYQQDQPQQ